MNEWIAKMLKISPDSILFYDNYNKIALVEVNTAESSGFILIKMVSLVSPKLNDLGYEPTPKEIKKYFPFVVKAAESRDFAETLYNLLIM